MARFSGNFPVHLADVVFGQSLSEFSNQLREQKKALSCLLCIMVKLTRDGT
jgi:hypothetical protein